MAEAAVQSATGMGPNSRKLVSDTVLQEGILVCNGYELLPPSNRFGIEEVRLIMYSTCRYVWGTRTIQS